MHRLTYVVDEDEHADPFVPEVRRGGQRPQRQAVHRFCRVPAYWNFNLHAVKKLGVAKGGQYVEGTHWAFAGGQIKSLLSLLSFLGKGQNEERYLGVKIPPTNLQSDNLDEARTFAAGLVDLLSAKQAA